MAEGWARHLKGDLLAPFSAGVRPKGMDPRAVKVMAEAGIDISRQKSKDVNMFRGGEFDYVITLCDHAREVCPYFPAKIKLLHKGFDDPARLVEDARDEDEAMGHYRRIRDEIRRFVEGLPEAFH